MLLIGALAVMLMLWMASGGVGDNSQPGALIALFVFARWRHLKRLLPLPARFNILPGHRLCAAYYRTDRAAA